MPLQPRTPAQMDEMRLKLAQDRAAAESYQQESSTIVDGSVIQPAIGRTGKADNVGWELITPGRADRFYATKELCLAALGNTAAY